MLEFQKITKKESLELLEKNNSFLIQSIFKDESYVFDLVKNRYNDIEEYCKKTRSIEKRYCIKKQSNAMQFSNGSWLYFNDFQKAYKYNNWIILSSSSEYGSNCMVYRIC